VAVVGPAPSTENVANEIDSFDVVIRMNYRGQMLLPDYKEFGSKVHISYYNSDNARAISGMKEKGFFEDLDYAVFKKIRHDYQYLLVEKKRGRVFFSPNNCFFIGSANLLQYMLNDLIYFRPVRIKVFKVNFFLAQETYHAGYALDKNNLKNFTWRWTSFAIHDQITQLNYVRNLWKSSQIEVDKACKAVLGLSSAEYMSRMENIYVEQPIKIAAGGQKHAAGN